MIDHDAIRAAILASLPPGVEARVTVGYTPGGALAEIDLTALPKSMPLRSPEYLAHVATGRPVWTFKGTGDSLEVQAVLRGAEAAAKAACAACIVFAGLDVHLAWSDVPRKRWTGSMYAHAS